MRGFHKKPSKTEPGLYSPGMSNKDLKDILKPIVVPRFYKPNDIIANSTYYTTDTEKKLLAKYAEVCGGELNKYPPMVVRNSIKYDTYSFINVEIEDIVGTIQEIRPDAFIVEPTGPSSRKKLEYAIENGFKAAYELIAPKTISTLSVNGTDVEVLEITPKAKIICVNMIKR